MAEKSSLSCAVGGGQEGYWLDTRGTACEGMFIDLIHSFIYSVFIEYSVTGTVLGTGDWGCGGHLAFSPVT